MLHNPQGFSKLTSAARLLGTWASRAVFTVVGVVLVVLGSGCTGPRDFIRNGFKVGPNYAKPMAPVADEWIDSKSKGVNTANPDLSDWWKVFKDDKLDWLVRQAYQQNIDLRTAGTRIMAARAVRNIAAGNLFPQFQEAFADVSRNAVSSKLANVPPGFKQFFDNNAVGLNLSWELDFWGRFRRAIESADAELNASIENYDDVLVVLLGDVAANYVQYRVFQQRIEFAAANVAEQAKLVKEAEDRLKGGVGMKLDVAQARSNLANTQALKEQLEIGQRLANNRLCVLLGVPVRDLAPELGKGPIPVAAAEVVVGMPADLLRRRPDVRRAERLVAAQSARIGIATADLYPRLSLIGSLGYEAENFGDLFRSSSLSGSIGPNLRWDILNYGRLVNGIRVQDALFQTRVTEYQSSVLRAGREVEDGVIQYLQAQKQTQRFSISVEEAIIAAQEADTLSRTKAYDGNRLFVTSNFKTQQQDSLAVAQGDIALGLIQVYRALGGGWEIRQTPAAIVVEELPRDKMVPGPIGSMFPAAPPTLATPGPARLLPPSTMLEDMRLLPPASVIEDMVPVVPVETEPLTPTDR